MAHILVIEDSWDIGRMVTVLLASVGHTVTIMPNGLSGLRCAYTDHPDLIVMDLALPQLDGWETTRELKATPETAHIPVIAFTANLTTSAIERTQAVGCCGVIAKPFAIDDFLHQIDRVLARSPGHARERVVGQTLER
jgi:two-component system, cell cycle response regulator DivK